MSIEYTKINYEKKNIDLILRSIYNYWNYPNYELLKEVYLTKLKNKELIFYKYKNYGFWSLHFKNNRLYITDLFIYEKYRKKGYGTRMLKYAIYEAKKVNKDNIYQSSDIYLETNGSLLNFYKKNGFHIHEINDTYYTMKLNNHNKLYYIIPIFLFLGLYISRHF